MYRMPARRRGLARGNLDLPRRRAELPLYRRLRPGHAADRLGHRVLQDFVHGEEQVLQQLLGLGMPF